MTLFNNYTYLIWSCHGIGLLCRVYGHQESGRQTTDRRLGDSVHAWVN